jgi:hypothetical protein
MPKCCFEGCVKKLLLTDTPCKCEKTFCRLHRHSDTHQCSFDYKNEHTKNLLKTMSTAILAKKVDVI